MSYPYENEINPEYAAKQQAHMLHRADRATLATGLSQGVVGFAPAVPSTSLAERLAQFIQITHESAARLSSVRERLCGPWPESCGNAVSKPPTGQIDSLLDELQSALLRISESATVINNRV